MDYLRGFKSVLGGQGETTDGPSGADTVSYYDKKFYCFIPHLNSWILYVQTAVTFAPLSR